MGAGARVTVGKFRKSTWSAVPLTLPRPHLGRVAGMLVEKLCPKTGALSQVVGESVGSRDQLGRPRKKRQIPDGYQNVQDLRAEVLRS